MKNLRFILPVLAFTILSIGLWQCEKFEENHNFLPELELKNQMDFKTKPVSNDIPPASAAALTCPKGQKSIFCGGYWRCVNNDINACCNGTPYNSKVNSCINCGGGEKVAGKGAKCCNGRIINQYNKCK